MRRTHDGAVLLALVESLNLFGEPGKPLHHALVALDAGQCLVCVSCVWWVWGVRGFGLGYVSICARTHARTHACTRGGGWGGWGAYRHSPRRTPIDQAIGGTFSPVKYSDSSVSRPIILPLQSSHCACRWSSRSVNMFLTLVGRDGGMVLVPPMLARVLLPCWPTEPGAGRSV